ncbi:hypothetical protein [Helicobacter canis]|nr:hypothetical protein [Helicobacter canis]
MQCGYFYGEFAIIDLIDTNFHNFYGEFAVIIYCWLKLPIFMESLLLLI